MNVEVAHSVDPFIACHLTTLANDKNGFAPTMVWQWRFEKPKLEESIRYSMATHSNLLYEHYINAIL